MSKELTDAEVKVLTELSYKKSIKKGNKMSKELTALEEIKTKYQNDNGLLRRLDIIEKSLKALEIIKEKKIDVNAVIYYLKMEVSDDQVCHWYNDCVIDADEEPERVLYEEDLVYLKEVLL